VTPPWYSRTIYAIDKGLSLLMIENYLTGLVWRVYTGSPYIQNGLRILGFRWRKERAGTGRRAADLPAALSPDFVY
jgi:hypothetical protein